MRILSMTATFGKLDHKTLNLKPGLNVIEAPNEWGKSTWCAFLVAMLYGIDTSQRTSQAVLSDKEHYAPWSGQPMSGRLDILWNGKAITIERSSTKRVPLGEFRAYETQSGLPVPELTADRCGQVLLGVERSVFVRAGFIRQADMPVTQDEALRRRLNALVTTGDENQAADRLAEKLKELKNRCRHNKTGALPQAEARQAALKAALDRQVELTTLLTQATDRQVAIQQQLDALENHRQALVYERSKEGSYRLQLAKDAKLAAQQRLTRLEAQTAQLPDRITLTQKLAQLKQVKAELATLEARPIPQDTPYCHDIFGDLSPEQALEQARNHKAAWDQMKAPGTLLPLLAAVCIAAGIGLSFIWAFAWLPALAVALLLLGMHIHTCRKHARVRKLLSAAYGALPPELWISTAEAYMRQESAARAVHEDHWKRINLLRQLLQAHAGDLSPDDAAAQWHGWLDLYEELENARREMRQAALREADLAAAVISAQPPQQEDLLTLSEEETRQETEKLQLQLKQLQLQAGQYQGQLDSLGQEADLRRQLAATQQRIQKLTELYEATVLAQTYLEQATLQLQQRFAPQLTAKAKALFATLTDGRYDRLILDQQLQLQTGAEDEDGLRSARWRSDGTADQLYLALRLAVAQQLTPTAPLVLDDVLVRFDDTRHSAAMALLLQQVEEKQILLFTCQSREGAYTPESIIEI